ncbi:MAG: GntR family transcriptional regulator, partial [Kiritimatiellae bacterium]|nr:GntR family transcriptional regulator [Kiritimatiellia bacterium]
ISHRDQVLKSLADEIEDGRRTVGSRLPSLRTLASRFQTGIFPVRQAIAALMERGYVETRHGSGVFVRDRPQELNMADSVMLCMEATGHVFGELTHLLHDRLHNLGMFASTLDMGHGGAADLLRRAQYSASRFLLVHAGGHFPFESLDASALRRKHVIAVGAWESGALLDQVHRILVDHADSSRLVVEHLWTKGHRHVLLVGPHHMLTRTNVWNGCGECPPKLNVQGTTFAGLWTRRGGRITPFPCAHEIDKGPPCDEEHLVAIMAGRGAATAVVGMRDVDAWDVRETLRRGYPEALKPTAFIGDGDTPWSQTSYPPFTTLNWKLDEIADLATGIIRDIKAGKTFNTPVVRMVTPRLVVRGERRSV